MKWFYEWRRLHCLFRMHLYGMEYNDTQRMDAGYCLDRYMFGEYKNEVH